MKQQIKFSNNNMADAILLASNYAKNPASFYQTEETRKYLRTSAQSEVLASAERNKHKPCSTPGCHNPRHAAKSGIVRDARCKQCRAKARAKYKLKHQLKKNLLGK